MNIVKKHKDLIIKCSLIVFLIVAILLYSYVNSIKDIVNIILISFVLAYVLKPIKEMMKRKTKMKGNTISLIIILAIIGMFFVILFLLVPSMFKEINSMGPAIEQLYSYIEELKEKYNVLKSPMLSFIYEQISEKASTLLIIMSENIVDSLIAFSENILSLAVIPVVTYYFLADAEKINKKVFMFVPIEKRMFIKKIFEDIDKLLGRYILSQVILSLIIGVVTFVILIGLRVKFPLGLSLLNSVFNIVPYFGPIFGAIPIIIVALIDSPTKCFWVAICIIILQQIEGNILSPKITGDSTNMHPLIIIILLLIGEKLGGFTGMIIAVPIGVIIKVIYDDINYYLL